MKKNLLAITSLSVVLALSAQAQSGTSFAPMNEYSAGDLGPGPLANISNAGTISGGVFDSVQFRVTFDVTALSGGNLFSSAGVNQFGIGNINLDPGESLFLNNFAITITNDQGTGATAADFTVGLLSAGWTGFSDVADDVVLDTDGDSTFETIVTSATSSFGTPLSYLAVRTDVGGIRLNNANFEVTAVPEPSAAGLLGGVFALAWVMVRRRR